MTQLDKHELLDTPHRLGIELVVVVKEELGIAELCEKSGFAGRVFLDAAAGAAAAAAEPSPGGLYAAIGAQYYALPMEEAMADERIQAHGKRSRENSWVEGNMEGEGRQLGGLVVGGQTAGSLSYGFVEAEWGDHAVHEDPEGLLAACRVVTGKAGKAAL